MLFIAMRLSSADHQSVGSLLCSTMLLHSQLLSPLFQSWPESGHPVHTDLPCARDSYVGMTSFFGYVIGDEESSTNKVHR